MSERRSRTRASKSSYEQKGAQPSQQALASAGRLSPLLRSNPPAVIPLAVQALEELPLDQPADRSLIGRLLAQAYLRTADFDRAESVLGQALRDAQLADNPLLLARCHNGLGAVHFRRGQVDLAMGHFRDMYRQAQQARHREGMAHALYEQAVVNIELGAHELAADLCRRGIRASAGVARTQMPLRSVLARCNAEIGQLKSALRLFRLVHTQAQGLADQYSVCIALLNLGRTHVKLGQRSRAAAFLAQSIVLAQKLQSKNLLAAATTYLAEYHLVDSPIEACDAAQKSLGLAIEINDVGLRRDALRVLAAAERALGRAEQALAAFEEFSRLEMQLMQGQLRYLSALASESVLANSSADQVHERRRRTAALAQANRRLRERLFAAQVPAEQAHVSRSDLLAAPRAPRLPLTPREQDILQLVTAGSSNVDIAKARGLSTYTVRHHVTSILRKLNVKRRTEAAVIVALGSTSPVRADAA